MTHDINCTRCQGRGYSEEMVRCPRGMIPRVLNYQTPVYTGHGVYIRQIVHCEALSRSEYLSSMGVAQS